MFTKFLCAEYFPSMLTPKIITIGTDVNVHSIQFIFEWNLNSLCFLLSSNFLARTVWTTLRDGQSKWSAIAVERTFKDNMHFEITRHEFYYKWLYFGWRPLPYNYPLYNHSNDPMRDNVTNWVQKSVTREEYLAFGLFTYINFS